MIEAIRGEVYKVTEDGIIVETKSGVSYKVFMSDRCMGDVSPKKEIFLLTHHAIKENSEELYGFRNESDKLFFQKMIAVKGVGEKTVMGMLNTKSSQEIQKSILEEDITELCKLPKIGKKSAQTIVIALKDKISQLDVNLSNAENKTRVEKIIESTVAALIGLGVKKNIAIELAEKNAEDHDSVQTLIQKCLLSNKEVA